MADVIGQFEASGVCSRLIHLGQKTRMGEAILNQIQMRSSA